AVRAPERQLHPIEWLRITESESAGRPHDAPISEHCHAPTESAYSDGDRTPRGATATTINRALHNDVGAQLGRPQFKVVLDEREKLIVVRLCLRQERARILSLDGPGGANRIRTLSDNADRRRTSRRRCQERDHWAMSI